MIGWHRKLMRGDIIVHRETGIRAYVDDVDGNDIYVVPISGEKTTVLDRAEIRDGWALANLQGKQS